MIMKPPNIPGAEKFKFSDKKYLTIHDNNNSNSNDCNNDSAINVSNFLRGIPSRSTCPLSSSSASSAATSPMTANDGQPISFSRSDNKRKPIFPISSRMTSRVFTLTHLPLESFDIRDYTNTGSLHKHYLNGAKYSSVSSDPRSLDATNSSSASRVSLFSDLSGSQCSSHPSPRSLCSPVDRSLTPSQWAKSAHRLSTSSQSSWEDGPDNADQFWSPTRHRK
ncbi:uncharacterized protein LOC128964633 [Oppia nitens]|uniref:uncharacterized protein LOC128964633 n=1 Tax=Oppia nitens TaxID=1686743 RepID=UPI0023DBADC8|nr:uncharacterized protein LOC128964633 [Oppia nitens]